MPLGRRFGHQQEDQQADRLVVRGWCFEVTKDLYRRMTEIGDFAGIAVFLASPASDFVTGTAIPVDGGFSVMS